MISSTLTPLWQLDHHPGYSAWAVVGSGGVNNAMSMIRVCGGANDTGAFVALQHFESGNSWSSSEAGGKMQTAQILPTAANELSHLDLSTGKARVLLIYPPLSLSQHF